MSNELWCEKYRPKKIADCILPATMKDTFQQMVNSKELPHLLLSGPSGCGKTTVARALCDELGYDCLFINASESGNIDTLRTDIRNFAATISLSGGVKVVILDEADYVTQAAQSALRGFLEEFHHNCRFIFTCNFPQKILDALHSRCSCIDFRFTNKDRKDLIVACFKRIANILKEEKVEFDQKTLVEIVGVYFPDFRRMLNELQKYSLQGKIDVGILSAISVTSVSELVKYMKEKNFTEVRKWAALHSDMDPNTVLSELYKLLEVNVSKATLPAAILTLYKYMASVPSCADKEILLTACAAELMLEQQFV